MAKSVTPPDHLDEHEFCFLKAKLMARFTIKQPELKTAARKAWPWVLDFRQLLMAKNVQPSNKKGNLIYGYIRLSRCFSATKIGLSMNLNGCYSYMVPLILLAKLLN